MIQDGPIYDDMRMIIQRLKDSFEDISTLSIEGKVNALVQQNFILMNLVEELFTRTDLSEYELMEKDLDRVEADVWAQDE